MEFENPAVVKPQSFPDCVPALHGGIERTDAGFIAMHELTVDIDNQVAIFLVEFLEH